MIKNIHLTLMIFWIGIVIILFMPNEVLAQNKKVTGKVLEGGFGLPGVNILKKGTSEGTVTDVNGEFIISASSQDVLIISFVGYVTQEIQVGNRTSISVDLESDVKLLEEVVVVGYGSQTKKEVTGAVSNIGGEDLVSVPTPDLSTALQGKIAGVNIQASDGSPGSVANVQIRGLGSVSANRLGPLYVVDGIPQQVNPNIAPSQIESIDVLKDGASAAIYGVRGANGVILITTKQGKAGKLKVNFGTYHGIQSITSGVPLMSVDEQFYFDEIRTAADNRFPSVLSQNPLALRNDTDFLDAVQNDNAPISSYDLNVSGGKGDLTINANVNYFRQQGALINSEYDRLTTRLTTNYTSGKFNLFASVAATNDQRDREPFGLQEFAISQFPWGTPIADLPTNGEGVIVPDGNEFNFSQLSSRLANTDEQRNRNLNIALRSSYEIIDGLKYEVRLGLNDLNVRRTRFEPRYLVFNNEGILNAGAGNATASLRENYRWLTNQIWENVITFNRSFNKHNVGFTGVLSYERYVDKNVGIGVVFSENSRNSIRVPGAAESSSIPTSFDDESTITGKLARFQYNYDQKYLFSMSLRYDGSSKFNEENRYELFPSVSLGWNIVEESFFNVPWIDDFKLRGSLAAVGNNNIPSYSGVAIIESGVNYLFGRDEQLTSGLIQRRYVDPTIQWETTISRNIGVDLSLAKGRINIVADYYENNKKDMLLPQQLPLSSGTFATGAANVFSTRTVNAGNMTNKGIELAVTFQKQTAFGLNYSLTGTFTRNRNKVTDLDGVDIGFPGGRPVQTLGGVDNTTFLAEGYAAGSFFLVPTDGVIQTQEELEAYRELDPNARLGDLRYVNTDDSNNRIDDNDRVFMGSGQAKFESGIVLNMDYKKFDLSIQGYYSYGAKIFNGARMIAFARGRHADQLGMWTPQNPDSNIPVFRGSNHNNVRAFSDQFLEDGTYFRVRTISLGYTFGAIKKLGFESARVYFNSLNPITITKYTGFDPEVGGDGIFTRGVDIANYPIARQFLLGVDLRF